MSRPGKSTTWMGGIIVVITLTVISIAGGMPAKQQQDSDKSPAQGVPPITSKIKNLKIEKVDVKHLGTPGASVTIEVKNDSELPVIAVAVTFGRASTGADGGLLSDEPKIAIPPHGKIKFYISMRNLKPDEPVEVSGVIYADGTEEGKDSALRMMHEQRKFEKEKRDAQKGGPKK